MVLLAVLAVVFGLAGTVAPVAVVSPQLSSSSSSSDSVAHFVNPPTYDSGWMNITDKCGQHVTLVHNLSTMDVTVDITGRAANLTEENWHQFWSMGDVDEDGYVTETDVDLIVDHFGSSDPQYDINEDGTVDILDISICLGNIGKDIWTCFGAEIHQRHLGGTGYMPWWSRTYGGADDDEAYSLVQTDDGGYALAGYTESFDVALGDFYLVKTNSAGVMLWNKTYGGGGHDRAYSVVQTLDGGYAIAGETRSFGPGPYENFWLVKTDSAGNMLWNHAYGRKFDWAQSVVQTLDGGFALAGPTVPFGAGDTEFGLVKSDVEMGLAWTGSTANTTTLYRGKTDPYWNYVRVRIWTIQEPTWLLGDLDMDGDVDAHDLYILSRN